MSTSASDLVERMERETGQRIDDNDGGNLAMAGLFGAVSRMMGKSPPSYRKRDDVVAGLLLREQMTPEYQRRQEGQAPIADMLRAGMSPDDVGAIFEEER